MLLLFVALAVAPAFAVDNRNCTQFCMNLTSTCTGANIQYPNPDTNDFCVPTCEAFSYGIDTPIDTSGDTYNCRVYHLSVARSNPPTSANTHCPHAGFDGGDSEDLCGDYCDAYCDVVNFACTGANQIQAFVNASGFDRTRCELECEFFPAAMPKIDLGSAAASTGDTRDCRMWHAQFAAGDQPAANAHCNHASPVTYQAQCGSMCENYCDIVMSTCVNALQQWKDKSQCVLACGAFPQTPVLATDPIVTGGNSVGCRRYHAITGYAVDNLAFHCPHTGPLGGGSTGAVCTDNNGCDGFCNLTMAMCPSAYTDNAACNTACATWTWNQNSTQSILAMSPGLLAGSLDIRTCAVLNGKCDQVVAGLKCSSATAIQAAWSIIVLLLISLGLSL